MSWGTELWDQFDNVTDHAQRGIDFVERYGHFVRDRSRIELEYSKELRKLVKTYLPKKEKEESPFTVMKSFNDALKEVADIAGQHQLLSELLQQNIFKEMTTLMNELKAERKKSGDDAKKLDAQLQNQIKTLEQAKLKYENSFREHVKATQSFELADKDVNLSRAEVEKTRINMQRKSQICDDCKTSYGATLEQTNVHRREYYNKTLPQVLQALQEMDERRITKVQESLKRMAEIERSIQPIINTCLDGIVQASAKIEYSEDSKRVVDRYKSGFAPPEDFPFEDLSNEGDRNSSNGTPTNKAVSKNTVGKNTNTVKGKKRSGLGIFGGRADEVKEDFSHLTPQQQKNQLMNKIASIKSEIAKENAGREGVLKMYEVYTANPSLGDPKSVAAKLEESKRKLDDLEEECKKYETYLTQTDMKTATPVMGRRPSVSSYHSNQSNDLAPSSLQIPQKDTRQPANSSSHRSDSFDDNGSFDDDEYTDVGNGSVGQATALYPFEATSAGSVGMAANDRMSVIEADTGDGWTRVRKANGDEGFVPTSYLQIVLH